MLSNGLFRPFKLTSIAFTILLTLSFSQAQDAKVLPKHPRDVIKFDIKFDGPNAARIKTIGGGLSLRVGASKDQSGFRGGFGAGGIPPASLNTFHFELTVPNDIATGDYFLGISANADEGSASYQAGQEFQLPPIHIENPKTFVPPAVTVKELP
jgi:hypothetical protein